MSLLLGLRDRGATVFPSSSGDCYDSSDRRRAATIDARDYAQIIKIGRTSITGKVESWVRRGIGEDQIAVTEGIFTYVALGDDRRPRPLPPDS